MITGLHGLFYTTDPEGARAFLRDKLGLPSHDAGGGWLIFEFAEGHAGCHPADRASNGVSFACDDLEATMREAEARGVAFTPVAAEEWGKSTAFELPGGGPVQIYEPTYEPG